MGKYDTFCLTFRNLNDIFEYNEPYSMVVATGIAKLFQLCFEQACAVMKEALFKSGIGSKYNSFRKILKDAYQCGMICDEQAWLSALETDDNMEFIYKKEIALKIVSDTKERFYPMFEALKTELEARWI